MVTTFNIRMSLMYTKIWVFFFLNAVMIQEDYHSQNPYHNAVHAADVTQAMHCYLKEPKVGGWKSPDNFCGHRFP